MLLLAGEGLAAKCRPTLNPSTGLVRKGKGLVLHLLCLAGAR